jgi:hypothetical protein
MFKPAPASIPVKVTVNTGRARYVRYGYLREAGSLAITLSTPGSEKFASSCIPNASVEDLEDATPAEVEAHPGRYAA